MLGVFGWAYMAVLYIQVLSLFSDAANLKLVLAGI